MSWGSFHHTLETHEDPREARIHAQEGAHNRRKCPAHCASRLLPHESCPEGGGGGAAPEHGALASPQRAMRPQGTDMRARVTRARRETRLQRLTWGMQVPRGVRKWASHTREGADQGASMRRRTREGVRGSRLRRASAANRGTQTDPPSFVPALPVLGPSQVFNHRPALAAPPHPLCAATRGASVRLRADLAVERRRAWW